MGVQNIARKYKYLGGSRRDRYFIAVKIAIE